MLSGAPFVLNSSAHTNLYVSFLEVAFSHVNLKWQDYVEIKEELYRPAEVDILIGDPSKAKEKLGWEPKVKFRELVKILVEHDLKNFKK